MIDVTVPIRPGMVTYPGDPTVHLERVSSIAEGEVANLSRLYFGVHSGTHINAPLHFIDGAPAAESLPLDVLLGPCEVVETAGLAADDVERAPEGAERILFKTPNSELWAQDTFAEEFARLDAAAAKVLVERGVRLVGVDYLSVGDEEAHRVRRVGRSSGARGLNTQLRPEMCYHPGVCASGSSSLSPRLPRQARP